jgi:hypothetical protein
MLVFACIAQLMVVVLCIYLQEPICMRLFFGFWFEKEESTVGLWELAEEEEVVVVDDVVEMGG